MEFSAWDQFIRTPWLFIKNLPGAFIESVQSAPQDISEGVKGVTEDIGEGLGRGVQALTRPLLPFLIVLAVLGIIVIVILSQR